MKKNNNIYIIAGKLKRRKIPILYQKKLKPTTNQIRETLFNWLNKKIINAYCLDCFSGSGALSIESISRGAKKVTLLEINKKIINNIKKTIKKFNIIEIKTIHTNTISWLKKKKQIMILSSLILLFIVIY